MLRKQVTNTRSGDGQTIFALKIVRIDMADVPGGPLPQIGHTSCCFSAEMEIQPRVQVRRYEPFEGLVQEIERTQGSELTRKMKDRDRIHPTACEHLDTLLVAHELLQAISMKELIRVDIEGERDALPVILPRRLAGAFKQVAMPLVHAIEHAERARSVVEERIVE